MTRSRALTLLAGLLVALAAGCSPPEQGAKAQPEYDPNTHLLTKLYYDANKNGKNESTAYMRGAHIVRVELDWDENGKVERWDIYNDDGSLQKVGLATRNDGVMDNQVFYSPSGAMERIEISTRRDGRFDRTEYYTNNVLIRSEDDTNHDGRPDKWDTYMPVAKAAAGLPAYTITSTAFDEDGRGKPTRRLIFGSGGSIVRVEIDPDGDGIFSPLQTSGHRTK